MPVVFGVDFDSLSSDLARALRMLESDAYQLVSGKEIERPDAHLAFIDSDHASIAADTVAIGGDSFEVSALDAGAMDFIVWPSLNQSLGAQFTASARRIRRLRDQQREHERLRRLDAARLRIAEADVDLDTLTQIVCDEMLASDGLRGMTNADGAIVELVDGDHLVYRAAAGAMGGYAGLTMPLDGTLSEKVISGGAIMVADDTESDARVDRDTCRVVGVRAMAAAPLFAGGKAVGTLKLVSQSPSAFGELDQRILRTMSEIVSAALGRELGREQLRRDLADRAKAIESLEMESASLRKLASTDPLTGLLNRRQFVAEADSALRRGAGRRPGVATLMIDLDQFKAINDAHGHAAGDAVLVAVASALSTTLRDGDILGRVGGEEFAVVLTRVDHDQAVAAAERVRAAIEACSVTVHGLTLRTTASIGLASINERLSQEEAFRRADSALYRAKSSGRNRVVLHRDADVMTFPGRAKGT